MARPFEQNCSPRRLLAAAALSCVPIWAGACASGGGGSNGALQSPLPLPLAPPPPPPAPLPSLPPASFETREYNAGLGLSVINAAHAYARGATGKGILVAVIDSGADQNHPDLQGQFAGPSFDVNAASRADDDIDTTGHGTLVSGIIAAKRDNAGVLGVAFEAKLLDIRADRPGSCAEIDDCRFPVSDIARAIDFAVENGAKVINLSLGSNPDTDQTVENAIADAVQSGVLVVVAAGNDAEPPNGSNSGIAQGAAPNSPARAAGFATSLGRVVAVGSVIASDNPNTPETERIGALSDFSNRAGPQAMDFYILAPGQGVISAGPDDNIVFQGDADNDPDTDGDYYRVSGTSFAAPFVSGSLALLLEAFPNLQARPEDALRILLDTADDYVDLAPDPITGRTAGPGTDAVSGVGLLNLRRAFEPQGVPTAVLNNEQVALSELAGSAGGAFGDWAEAGKLFHGISLIDKYGRTFEFDESSLSAKPRQPLSDLSGRAASFAGQTRAVRAGNLDFSWHTPRPPKDPVSFYDQEPASLFAASFRLGEAQVSAGRGAGLPRLAPVASLVVEPGTPDALSDIGNWVSLSQVFGPVEVHAFSSFSEGLNRNGAGLKRSGPSWAWQAQIESMSQNGSALGSAVQSRLGGDDKSETARWTMEGHREVAGNWRLSGGYEVSAVKLGGVSASGVLTTAWSMGATRDLGDATISFVLAQPRRAESGNLSFTGVTGANPDGWIIRERQIGLSPSGRQLNVETRFSWQFAEDWTAEGAAALVSQTNHERLGGQASALWFGLRGQF